MHPPIFGHSFAVLAALILLSGLAFNFLNRIRASARRNAEDADAGAAGSSASPVETDSGASSSSTAPTGDHYDVFLNFRGLDTRKSFVDHLYHGLVGAGIDVFLDDNELRHGEEIGPDLFEAIKNSKILIPILSENYCSSKWCLDELVQIMECKNNKTGHIVLPIFYKVNPRDVRHQSGSFGGAFLKRERPFNPATLEKYKQALTAVGKLKGREADGFEGGLVKSIVQEVLSKLKKDCDLLLPENLIGIDSHVENVMEAIANNSGATLFVGIYGMGGVGKTTLAKTICSNLSDQFEYHSFIFDIRELRNCKGLEYLQNRLISDMLKHKDIDYSKDQATRVLSSMLKEKKVLILLDDVDDDDQLKALAGNHNWFYSGSRIFITTRNKIILDKAGVDCYYEHVEMDQKQSLILFSRYAFRKNSPPSEFKHLADDVVSTTGGLPLSLEVLGSLLCRKPQEFWRGTIKKLREVPDKKVREKLKISYDALEYGQQQIFLDIACFLIGTDGRIASYMWDACGFFPEEGIAMLRFMSLIKLGDYHELRMHDQLRDLGREIIREENREKPQCRSRLWDSKEVLKVLEGNKGTENIKAIYFNKVRHSHFDEPFKNLEDVPFENFEAEQFKKLTDLRFLHVSGACLRGDFENSMGELKWLRWRDCPSTFEANNFRLTELVVLDLSWSKVSDEWQGWSSMMAEKLKFLDLTGCQSLRSTVFLSAFKNLEVLILCNCENLEQIDSSIGDMKNLVRLQLQSCCRLVLSDIFRMRKLRDLEVFCMLFTKIMDVSQLNQLRTLVMQLCHNVHEVRGLDKLIYLEYLIISMCHSIKKLDLPKNLETACVEDCKNIVEIKSLNRLEFLEELKIDRCPSIERLDLAKFEGLKNLDISCENLVEIQGLNRLKFLENLYIREGNVKKLDLPKGLKILCFITSDKSCEIEDLSSLEFLEDLDLCGSDSIEKLDLSKFKYLKRLSCHGLQNLVEIQGLNRMMLLESIDISWVSIERLDLSKSNGLRTLHLDCCDNLVGIQCLNKLKFLREMIIDACDAIKWLDLSKCEGLKILDVQRCKNLGEIQGLDKLEVLEKLRISVRTSPVRLLNLCCFDTLRTLHLEWCKNLVEIQGLDRMMLLESINISWVSNERLDLSKSNGLRTLHFECCENLVEIQGLNKLKFLREMIIDECNAIKWLDLSKCEGLKILDVHRCENLVEIQGLDKLEVLEKLRISVRTSLVRLLNLCCFDTLRTLHLEWCKNLVEIQGLDRMMLLREMIINECNAIEQLDFSNSKGLKFLRKIECSACYAIKWLDLSKCEGLKILNVHQCETLVEIQGLDKLEVLEELRISVCTSLVRLPNLCCFDTLRCLMIVNCDKLHDIQNLERLTSCETLYIKDCKFLAKLPNLSNFHNLRHLSLLNCDELREIPGFEKLTSLQVIVILGCSSIEILPDFSSCTNLFCLIVQNCVKLTELQGLEKSQRLLELDISGCESLKTIPELSRGQLYQKYELKRRAIWEGAREWSTNGRLGFKLE